jgi:hypothetical protein
MGRKITICFISILLVFLTLAAQTAGDTENKRPDWMNHSQKNYLKVDGGHWFFGFAEGQVAEDVRTASFKNAQKNHA